MQTESKTLGQKIKRYRLINDIRQEDMAEKMGVSRATLINYEKGHTAINIDVLNRLKNIFPNFDSYIEKNTKPQILTNNSIDFKVLYNVLFDQRKYILLITILFGVIGTGLSFSFKKYYKSEISLYPAKNDSFNNLGQFQSLAANLGMNTADNGQSFNIPDVVKSRLIATKAVNNIWITQKGDSTSLIDLWKLGHSYWSKKNKDKIDPNIIREKAIKIFLNRISISEDRITRLIKISTNFQDPLISANIANFIGQEVEKYIQKENSAQSKKEKLFIGERLLVVKSELESAENRLKQFKERNRGYDGSPELFMIFSRLDREVEAKKEVYVTLQQQLELARIEEVKRSPILHVLDEAVPPIKKSSPNRLSFLFLSLLFGFIFSSIRTINRY